ncbi:MAG: ATP-binding protein [Victivallales bacterium]|nr:ATP-binding protein [Victivallales bacterium]
MPESTAVNRSALSRELLEKAFHTFQQQCETLEHSHADLKARLAAAQLDLQHKNTELAARLLEIEAIRERLSGTLNSITDAVFVVDSDRDTIEPANPASQRLLELLPSASRSLFAVPPLARLIHAGEKIGDHSLTFQHQGESYYWLVSVTPMRTSLRDRHYTVVTIKDLTAQKNLEIRLAREDRMAALGKVAASVAHEIRNPLAAIEGFAALLERDLADQPASRRLAAKTVYAARQLNAVVGNLLSYTREYRPEPCSCRVDDLVADAVNYITPMAEDQGVTVRVELPPTLPPLQLDIVMMRQVLANILTNAVEAIPRRSGGQITITAAAAHGQIQLTVADNGPGIPVARKKRIFEPFYTAKTGGIGLGLALCLRIVEAHDGTIEEVGTPGGGAQMQITLKYPENTDD